jgi:hypothetical protein
LCPSQPCPQSSYLWFPVYLGSQVHAATPGLIAEIGFY